MSMRLVLAFLVSLWIATVPREAVAANDYPMSNRPIRIITLIVGGAPDVFSRLLGKELTERLGTTVVVENKPGAGGNIAAEAVVRSPPDGHTLLMSSPVLAMAPYDMKSQFDPIKDLAPIALIAETDIVVVASKSSNIRTLADLVNEAKRNPGKLNYATMESTPVSFASMKFERIIGASMTAIPFKGSPEGQLALARGDVDVMMDVLPSSQANIANGTAIPLAVASQHRNKHLPNVPTATEQGVNYLSSSWNGLFAPAGTPPEVVNKLASTIEAIMNDPTFRQRIESAGARPKYMGPSEFKALLQSNILDYRAVRESAAATPSTKR